MKKRTISILAVLMALATLAGAFASCQNNNNGRDETTSSNVETPESNTETQEGSTEAQGSESEESTGEETEPPVVNDNKIANKNDPIIELAASTANGVQAYFTDAGRTHYSIVNSEMTMNYARSNTSAQLVESIKNTNGVAYIQNTMDVFVRMKNGSTYYASESQKSAEANLYRFGYYYYEGLFEFQNFIPTK